MNEREFKEQVKQEIKQELKESARKKRMRILAIVVVIVLGLFIYIQLENKDNGKDYVPINYDDVIADTTITEEEFSQCIKEEIEITTENWQDYFTIEDTTTDMGDITKISTQIKIKDNFYGYAILKLKVTDKNLLSYSSAPTEANFDVSGFPITIDSYLNLKNKNDSETVGDYTISIDNLECIEAKGTIHRLDIPQDLWEKTIDGRQLKDYITELSLKKYNEYKSLNK